jgi:hypothetical protein
MHPIHIAVPVVILIICAIFSGGCTQPQPPPTSPVTPVETTVAITEPGATCSLTPGPIDLPPAYQSVFIEVMKNPISTNPYITTNFAGGQGLGSVVVMTTTVIRSDCVVEIGSANYPQIGTNITLMGTTRTDRVIVNVTMTDGMTYTVIDRDVPFQN